MAWLIKYFPWVQVPITQGNQSGMVAMHCNLSAREVETGGSLELTGQLVLSNWGAPGVVRNSVWKNEQDRGSARYQTLAFACVLTHTCLHAPTHVNPYTHDACTYLHDTTLSPDLKQRQFEDCWSLFRKSLDTLVYVCSQEEDLSHHTLLPIHLPPKHTPFRVFPDTILAASRVSCVSAGASPMIKQTP